jgi:hypothetical protein
MATQSQNGVAKKAPTKAPAKAANKETKNPVIKMADETLKKMVLLEETMSRVNDLQKLVDDYSKVSETLKGLSEFKGGTGESVQFALNDLTSDVNFTTYNSKLVELVLSELVKQLKMKQSELIDRILNFEM